MTSEQDPLDISLHQKLADYFHSNFYSDLPKEDIIRHLQNPEILDNGMNHIAETGHDDPEINDVSLLHGIHKIVTENPDIPHDDIAKKIAETHSKPLVNWFNRQKEFEYTNPTDKKGNAILDPKTGKPLEKTIKRVTAPDSILSPGFTKTVTKGQDVETDVTPAKRINIGLPFPTVSLPILGAMAGNFIGNSLINNGRGFSTPAGKNLSDVLPSYLGMILGGSAGTAGMGSLWKKYDMTFLNKNQPPLGSGFLTDAKSITNGALEMVTGAPVNLFGHDFIIPKKVDKKVVNTRDVQKIHNTEEGDIKLSPRFL